jgi:hypothetical protein
VGAATFSITTQIEPIVVAVVCLRKLAFLRREPLLLELLGAQPLSHILRRHDDCRLTRPECELQWWLRLLHGSESTVIWADRNKSDINSTAQNGSVLTNVTLWSLSVRADAKIDARTTEIAQIAIRLAQCSGILVRNSSSVLGKPQPSTVA